MNTWIILVLAWVLLAFQITLSVAGRGKESLIFMVGVIIVIAIYAATKCIIEAIENKNQ